LTAGDAPRREASDVTCGINPRSSSI